MKLTDQMPSIEERLASITRTRDRISFMERIVRLTMPLVGEFKVINYSYDVNNVPVDGRITSLSKSKYKEQYEAGIDRCLGIDIVWVD